MLNRRLKIGIIIAAVVVFLMLLYTANEYYKNQNKNNKTNNTVEENVAVYEKAANTVISEEKVTGDDKEEVGYVINKFYTLCIGEKYDEAYAMLSDDTKRILYPTVNIFKENYCTGNFKTNMKCSYQSWITNDNVYTYKVKVYEDMISTGKSNSESFEDYVTMVPYQDTFKLNISGYIGRMQIFKNGSNDKLEITATVVDTFMNYKIYTFNIKNNTSEKVYIDTRKKTDTVYITDENKNKFEAMMYELAEEETLIKGNENKTIQIKFSSSYLPEIEMKKISFTNIVKEADYLNNNNNIEGDTIEIKMD